MKKKTTTHVKARDNRNEPHFDHLRNYHPTTITESRKHRKPKYKEDWVAEAEEELHDSQAETFEEEFIEQKYGW